MTQDNILTETHIEIVGRIYEGPRRNDTLESSPSFFEWEVFQEGELKYRLRQSVRLSMDCVPYAFERWLNGEDVSFEIRERGRNSVADCRQPIDHRESVWRKFFRKLFKFKV